jgi:hypothetical protein
MTLAPDKQGFRYTRYRHDEVFSLLISRAQRTGVDVVHAAPTQGRRITIHARLQNEQGEWAEAVRVAVLLGRSSDWYRYRLNVYAVQFEGIEWIVCGTHDTCVPIPVWSVEEEKLYNKYETRIAFADLLTTHRKYWKTEFGHKLLLGGMICNLPEARQVALKLKKSARFALEAEVRKHAHRRKGPQLKLSEPDPSSEAEDALADETETAVAKSR